jgi:hypothetical protein
VIKNLENVEAKSRYRAVKIPQWVVTPGKQTNLMDYRDLSYSVRLLDLYNNIIDNFYDFIFVSVLLFNYY